MRRPRPVSTVLALALALLAVPAVRGAASSSYPPGVNASLDGDTTPDSVTAQRPALEASRSSSPSPNVLRACARIGPHDLVRLHGDFGEFQGFASAIGPEGVDGLRARPERGAVATPSTPAGRLTWDRIDRVDRRGSGWHRGAVLGGIIFGALGASFGYQESTHGIFDARSADPPLLIAGKTVGGFCYLGALGAVIGGGVGWLFPAWHHVYVRP